MSTNEALVAPVVWGSQLNAELSSKLCKAVREHPTLGTAAHSCGVSVKTLKSWLRRGSEPGANPILIKFALDFAAASAAEAKEAKTTYHKLVKEGSNQAATQLKYMNFKWRDREIDDLEDILSGDGKKKSDDLEKLLLDPTPRLRGLLAKTGWERRDVCIDTEGKEVLPAKLEE